MKSAIRNRDKYISLVNTTPDEDGAWSNLAWLYAITGEQTKAIETERKAISIYPYDYTYYVMLGAFLAQSGQNDEAIGAYARALILFPRMLQSHFWRALQARDANIAEKSIQSAFRAIDQPQWIGDDLNRREVRARLAMEVGQSETAKALVNSINAQLPNLSGMWELEGELAESEGNRKDAFRDYKRAIFLDNTDPFPHEHLVQLEIAESDMKDVANETQEVIRLVQFGMSPGSVRRAIQYKRDRTFRNGQLPVTLIEETRPTVGSQVSTGNGQ